MRGKVALSTGQDAGFCPGTTTDAGEAGWRPADRGLQHRDLRPHALEPHHAVHPIALDRRLAHQLESELDEERRRGREVVDDDAHVVHALDRHAPDGTGTTAPATASLELQRRG